MEYRKLGKTDLAVSVVGLGCNNFGRRIKYNEAKQVICSALDNGINFFDTADIYDDGNSEAMLGKALAGRRNQAIIATKVGKVSIDDLVTANSSRKHIIERVERSLTLLQTDYIDLYQIHTPDMNTPIEDTLQTLEDLIRLGKVRHIGNSNFSGRQIVTADQIAKSNDFTPFCTGQSQYNLIERDCENDIIPAIIAQGMSLLPYLPLANGMLTGKYIRGCTVPKDSRAKAWEREDIMLTEANFDAIEALTAWAAERGHSLLELAFSWLASQHFIGSIIAGATKPEQVKTNAKAANWKLTPDEIEEVRNLI